MLLSQLLSATGRKYIGAMMALLADVPAHILDYASDGQANGLAKVDLLLHVRDGNQLRGGDDDYLGSLVGQCLDDG